MWAIAEEKLRKDPQKLEKLEKYDRILEQYFKSKLKPVGTLDRRKQFFGFLNLETERLNSIDSENQLRRCSNNAKRFLRMAIKCVIATKDIIATAASPCLPASVACVGVTVLLSFCIQAADQRHLLFDGLNAVSGSIFRIAEYEDLLCNNDNQQTEEIKVLLTTACCNIIEFQARAACFLQANPVESVIRNAFKLDGWDTLLLAIKEAEAKVKDCAERKSMNYICKIFISLNEFKAEINDGFLKQTIAQETIDRKQRVNTFLQLLYDNACSYEDSKNRNRKRVTGTCDWFTDHELFKEWNLPKESRLEKSGLLFVTADPGCGKSVLSRYLIDQILPDDGRMVCYFFFKDDFENQRSSLRALCALLHQLFDLNRHVLTNAILDAHGARGEKFVESFFELWKTFIDAAGYQETVCVLDALDECQYSDRKQLIDAITGTQVPGLKFLLTSRPYEHIRLEVSKNLKAQMASIHLQGDRGPTADAIVREIKFVVDSRIDKIRDLFRLEPDEYQLMRKQLESVSNRTYLWITLVFDGLMEKNSGITKKDIMNLTNRLPQGVYDAYEKILKKSQDQEKSKKLLHLILGAKRPLSLAEVSVALAFNGQQSWDNMAEGIIPEDRIQNNIRNLCGLFITVVDKRVYFLHQTAREFLVRDFSSKKTPRSQHLSDPRNYDAAVTVFIIQHLTFLFAVLFSIVQPIVHSIWLFLTKSWQHSMDLTYSNLVLAELCISFLKPDFAKENTPMFEYSAIYWADHYHQSVKNYKAAAAERTRYLCLLEPRKQWTEIHNKHNSIPVTGSPLCLASALGLERVVELFLLEQASIGANLQDKGDSKESDNSRSPLSWAAGNGHEAVVKLLLATGNADVDFKDDQYNQTPLSWAAENGHEAVVKLLLATGHADVNSKDKENRTPLLWAAGNGHKAVVELLLATGKADVNFKDDKYNQTPLSWAAENGHEAVVKLLLATGKADINSKDTDYWTPLSWAAKNGHDAVVKLLLATGKANVNSKDYGNWTPLSWAARNGHDTVVKLLLGTDEADVDSKDNDNRTPLSWAARNRHEAVVKLLLATGKADVDSKDNKYNRTSLSCAAENGHKAVVELLLATGKANVNSKDKYNQTPILWASKNGHDTVVKLLLGTGEADVDSKDNDNRTPLSWAAGNRHEALVKLLLATGKADVDSKDNKYNRTSLSYAAENGHEALVKLLLATGKADVNSKDKYNQAPLLWAARNRHDAMVKLLLATGKANVNSKDNDNRTLLSWAAKNGHEAMVKLLLATGKADVDSKDNDNRTLLSCAAENGHETVVMLLLVTGKAKINFKDKYNQTPLLWASRNGHKAVVKLLLATGKADVDFKDKYNRTPLSWASRNKHEGIVKLLLATGKADVNSKDNDNRTPLSCAAENGHEAVIKLVLGTGKANINSKDYNDRTPLLCAAENGHEALVKLLLVTGKADINSTDKYNQTPLSWAARNGHKAVIKLLLATGKADVNFEDDKYKQTPLSWAAENGHEAVVKLLLATGKADINFKDYNNRTPLSWAARNGHEAVVKLLLATGKADTDSKDDKYNRTPLLWAAENGHEAMVKLLQNSSSS